MKKLFMILSLLLSACANTPPPARTEPVPIPANLLANCTFVIKPPAYTTYPLMTWSQKEAALIKIIAQYQLMEIKCRQQNEDINDWVYELYKGTDLLAPKAVQLQ